MSLTRAEWNDMWKSLKVIEREADKLFGNTRNKKRILREVTYIKDQVELVIGQQE